MTRFFILRDLDTETRYTALQFQAVHIDVYVPVRRITTVMADDGIPETLIQLGSKEFPEVQDCIDNGCKHLVEKK